MPIQVQFLGGTGTVTGSKFLIEFGAKLERRLLVDCGLFQGIKELRLQNRSPFPIDPRSIEAVFLTHAHLDHSGYLPLLSKSGFSGPIYCTDPTRDLSKLILLDSAKIQEEDADYANQKGFSKHAPALPLYNVKDALKAMTKFAPIADGVWLKPIEGVQFRFRRNGHIMGSAFVEIQIEGKTLLFSGDLGRTKPLILDDPQFPAQADFVFIETTYGDRNHSQTPVLKELQEVTLKTIEKKGHLIIPSFAVGRTQDLLYLFSKLKRQNKIPDIPIFLDSPLGINATEIFIDHPDWHHLNAREITDLSQVATLVQSRQQSQEIMKRKPSTVVIAGSGMVSGGRILHHLAHRGGSDRNTVLLVGFQAAGTRGRQLLDSAREVKIHGQFVSVNAEVREIHGLSAHAGQSELIDWLRHLKNKPKRIFLIHGEPQSSDAFRVKVKSELGWESEIPHPLEKIKLT